MTFKPRVNIKCFVCKKTFKNPLPNTDIESLCSNCFKRGYFFRWNCLMIDKRRLKGGLKE